MEYFLGIINKDFILPIKKKTEKRKKLSFFSFLNNMNPIVESNAGQIQRYLSRSI